MKKITVPIKGMHCRSCEITLEDNLLRLPNVKKANVSLNSRNATIYADKLPAKLDIKRAVTKAGYEIGYDEKPWISKNITDYKDVLVGIVVVAVLALIINNLGIANINTGNVVEGGILVALLIGLTAGFSTCMALVGGLVLGLSAKYAEKHPSLTAGQKFKPHLLFNLSRVISFFVFGGLIGVMGSAFQLQGPLLGALTLFVGVVMLILGLQLTNIFPRLSNGGLTLPAGIAKRLRIQDKQEYSHKNAAFLGIASFFLPCGFTQAMQLYAISTGSFVTGALVMGLFAIGTMPGLLSIGGLSAIIKVNKARRFFKVSGVIVVAMALINIANGYNLMGWPQLFANISEESSSPAVNNSASPDNKLNAIYTLKKGLEPAEFRVKANQSYTLEVLAMDSGTGCMSTILIPGLNDDVQYILKNKTNKLPFTAPGPGTYQITCAMGVPHGKIIVT